MASMSFSIPDIEQSVSRPAIYAVLEQLFETTGLSKDTEILFAGRRGVISTPGTTIDDKENKDARFQSTRTTIIEATESYDRAAVQEVFSHSYEQNPILLDAPIKFAIRPIYTPSDVELRIQYRSNSETEIRRWLAEMFVRSSRGRDINLHRIEYTYSIPFQVVSLIEDIWRLSEAVEGAGIDLHEYVTSHSTDRLTIASTQAGTYPLLSAKEIQTKIQGFFDFVGIPDDPERNSETGLWEISFTYKFSYQRIDMLYVSFPISVHNQLIPDRWTTPLESVFDPYDVNLRMGQGMQALDLFSTDYIGSQVRPPNAYIKIPSFDDFEPKSVPQGVATIFSALCFLEEDRQTLVDLHELGDYAIDEDVLAFLKAESSMLNKPYMSLYHIAVYENGSQIVPDRYTVTSDLKVKATTPFSYKNVYHVRLFSVVDLNTIVQEAIDRLSLYPKAFVKVLGSINELLFKNPDFNLLSNKRMINAWELLRVNEVVKGSKLGNIMSAPSQTSYTLDGASRLNAQQRKIFLPDIDQETLRKYFMTKRRLMPTVMFAGTIVHRLSEVL